MSKKGMLVAVPANQAGATPRLVTETEGLPMSGDPAAYDRNVANFDAAFETSAEGTTGLGVFVQDQTTPSVIVKANKTIARTTLTANVSIDDETCNVADVTDMAAGQLLIVTSTVGARYFTSRILGISSNEITLDSPFDYAFESGQEAVATTTDMAVDGSVTPEVFGLRVAEPLSGGIGLTVDVTRLIFKCFTDGATPLSAFGDIENGIEKGFLVRRRNGYTQNLFDFHNNGEMAELMYDWTPYVASNPSQGQNGFVGRLTFAGQSKIGVAIRLEAGHDIEFHVRDDLSDLELFEVTIEGHVVQ